MADAGPDTRQDGGDESTNDLSIEEDTTVPDVTDVVEETCHKNGITRGMAYATYSSESWFYEVYSDTTYPFDLVMISSLSPWNGPDSVGIYSLDGINYRDCGLCLLAYGDCTADECERVFYAETGSVEITAIDPQNGGRFAATLTGVVFEEVTIGTDYTSTVVEGGQTWCVDEFSFDEELTDPNAEVCELEDVFCVGEVIPDFRLTSCASGEEVTFSSLTEGQRAAWIIATAGWCSACQSTLSGSLGTSPISAAASLADEGVVQLIVLGENASFGRPTLEYCRDQYAPTFSSVAGYDLENFFIDHDGEDSWTELFGAMWPYPDSQNAIGLPWQAVINAQTNEYVYGDGAGVGSVQSAIEQLLAD